ncbi:hypothetical protein J3459_007352 [Metarhizium acridum]|nr:hypothetical protein J3459_019266 [Metarhizium acridum]KAG8406285.1 hypothetical protein J3459_019233 [Metarhizium acridum]KAG8427272.1 hypothetical protein J3459_007352 [Metarhizium acridum]
MMTDFHMTEQGVTKYLANTKQTLRLTATQDAGYAGEKISKRPVDSASHLCLPSDWVCIPFGPVTRADPRTQEPKNRGGFAAAIGETTWDDSCMRLLCYAMSVILEDVTEW